MKATDITTGVRTTLTLLVLTLVVIVFAGWGWNALTAPLPHRVAAPICSDTLVQAGDHLYPSQVTVSVINASKREGLASRALYDLKDAGFPSGSTGNAPNGTDVATVQIWTSDMLNPANDLVLSYLPGAVIVKHATTLPGVNVVVGKNFTEVKQGQADVAIEQTTEVCSPALS